MPGSVLDGVPVGAGIGWVCWKAGVGICRQDAKDKGELLKQMRHEADSIARKIQSKESELEELVSTLQVPDIICGTMVSWQWHVPKARYETF